MNNFILRNSEVIYLNKEMVFGAYNLPDRSYAKIEEDTDYNLCLEIFRSDTAIMLPNFLKKEEKGTESGVIVANNKHINVLVTEWDNYIAISFQLGEHYGKGEFPLAMRNMKKIATGFFDTLQGIFPGHLSIPVSSNKTIPYKASYAA